MRDEVGIAGVVPGSALVGPACRLPGTMPGNARSTNVMREASSAGGWSATDCSHVWSCRDHSCCLDLVPHVLTLPPSTAHLVGCPEKLKTISARKSHDLLDVRARLSCTARRLPESSLLAKALIREVSPSTETALDRTWRGSASW